MYAYIEGKLASIDATHAIVETNGIGFMLKISLSTYSAIQRTGEELIKLYTYLHIHESAHTLYGFAHQEEKELFLKLISVNGVGANTAIVILSSLSPKEFALALFNNDVACIQKVKGIGAKTAQRILLELKDKINMDHQNNINIVHASHSIRSEALLALTTLGLPKTTAEKNIEKVMSKNSNVTVEELVKFALNA